MKELYSKANKRAYQICIIKAFKKSKRILGTTILTFGTNTKHNVPVVQNIINTEIKMKTASRRSASTNAMAAPMIHIIRTLYTLSPICFESLSAGIETVH